MKQLPISCALSPRELEARRAALNRVADTLQEQRFNERSFAGRFTASAAVLADLADLVAAERLCCRFLRFHIIAEEDGGAIWLKVRGPAGTGRFMSDLLAAS